MLLRKVLHNWPQKLGALIAAVLLWLFVTTDESNIIQSQRSFFVPLVVEGLSNSQVATGIPDIVEVTLSGPSNRIDALRTESIDAFLDLRNAQQDFRQRVRVFPPQGLQLVRSNPAEVIGLIETKVNRDVPVQIALLGERPADSLPIVLAQPNQVTATGRAQHVERVAAAIATVRVFEEETSVQLYAADAEGQPVANVSLIPNRTTLRLDEENILHVRDVPILLDMPDISPWEVREVSLSQERLQVAGAADTIRALERITAPLDIPKRLEGNYTLTLEPILPEGVRALETLRVTFRLHEVIAENNDIEPEPQP